jgi:tetratricopeptide (TPR) repeat protein
MYKIIQFLILVSISTQAFTQKHSTEKVVNVIFEKFSNGNYEEVIKDLEVVQTQIEVHKKSRSDIQGLIYYWRGISYIKTSEYDLGIDYLKKAIQSKFKAKDIYYEYGQALYVSDQLKKARLAFKRSVKNKFKIAVSLYYIAYISQQLKDYKKAVSFYNMIEKMPEENSKDILQASRMQIAEIYLKQVEKLPDSFRSVEKYVIPKFKEALDHDPKSKLADELRAKIEMIQRRYDLIIFKMRNGRPTANPRHFLKANISYNIDDNVNSQDKDTLATLEAKDYASHYTNAGFFGRYSFYPSSSVSISPEISASYTSYQSDSTSIITSNNYFTTAGLTFNFEHSYNKMPATTYLSIDYTYKADDANADKKLEKSSTSNSVTLSEELQFWKNNPTTLRYKFSQTKALTETASFNTHSAIWEQLINRGKYSIFTYTAFDMNTYPKAESSNTNIFTVRADLILPTVWKLFNPSFFFSDTMTNHLKDTARATTTLYTYGLSLNRPIGQKLYATFNYTLESQTGKASSDVYSGSLIGLNIDYFY